MTGYFGYVGAVFCSYPRLIYILGAYGFGKRFQALIYFNLFSFLSRLLVCRVHSGDCFGPESLL
jgi:sugar phosphate permease